MFGCVVAPWRSFLARMWATSFALPCRIPSDQVAPIRILLESEFFLSDVGEVEGSVVKASEHH